MSDHSQSVFLAFGASLFFATASVVYARFSRQISSLWMNTMKSLLCWCALALTLFATSTWTTASNGSIAALFGSGALGLGLGDLFLLGAFARIGASRTLMVFGFQPLVMAVAGSLLFGQALPALQGVGILFFMLCLFILSFERYRQEGHWEVRGLVFALMGVLLDNTGVLLTRWSFDTSPALNPLQANLFRCSGALLFFMLIGFFRPVGLIRHFRPLPRREQILVIVASLAGTFVSLSLYLRALKIGHLASISAIVLTGPLYSAMLECLLQKKWPSRYLIASFFCLIGGMSLVLWSAH